MIKSDEISGIKPPQVDACWKKLALELHKELDETLESCFKGEITPDSAISYLEGLNFRTREKLGEEIS